MKKSLYGIGFWMPTIIKGFSTVISVQQVGFVTMIPYIAGGIAMVIVARHSDRTGERRYHTAISSLVGALGLLGSGLFSNPFIPIIMLSLATIGIYSFFGSFWSPPSLFLTEASAAVGIAIVNSVGNLGGFVGPYAIGALKDATGTVASDLYFLAGSLLVAGILALIIRKQYSTSLFAAADQKQA
ncbi:putative tartrate transporter [Peptococcaceae bacterium CEB3]|nr:putative tartrate transporter [Peptococcaceae bacterium CEB3]